MFQTTQWCNPKTQCKCSQHNTMQTQKHNSDHKKKTCKGRVMFAARLPTNKGSLLICRFVSDLSFLHVFVNRRAFRSLAFTKQTFKAMRECTCNYYLFFLFLVLLVVNKTRKNNKRWNEMGGGTCIPGLLVFQVGENCKCMCSMNWDQQKWFVCLFVFWGVHVLNNHNYQNILNSNRYCSVKEWCRPTGQLNTNT